MAELRAAIAEGRLAAYRQAFRARAVAEPAES
jgi:hypothetical protein